MHLSDGTAADQGRALAIVVHLRAGDLVMRDLGYLSLESLRQIDAHEAWYLSRFSKGVDVYLDAHAETGHGFNAGQFGVGHVPCGAEFR